MLLVAVHTVLKFTLPDFVTSILPLVREGV
jgi:hypothetical protein